MGDEDIGGEDPCLASHLVDGHPVDPGQARDVARLRRAERQRLYAARLAVSASRRAERSQAICAALDGVVGAVAGRRIAVYWPIRGEPDLRTWMHRSHETGARIGLPVVVEKNRPLIFRAWTPDCRMARGFWNIPVPAEGEAIIPDLVVAPLVGVDAGCYRLGNGGGYYDRTLVRIAPRPVIVGVGYRDCTIPTIFPMPWDVPMDVVVLDDGSVRRRRDGPAADPPVDVGGRPGVDGVVPGGDW